MVFAIFFAIPSIFLDKSSFTNRLSEATESFHWPQAEAWGFDTISALRAEESSEDKRAKGSSTKTNRAFGRFPLGSGVEQRQRRESFFMLLGEVDDGDAGASEADVFVMVGDYVGVDAELLSDECLQDAMASAVEDSHFLSGELDGIV